MADEIVEYLVTRYTVAEINSAYDRVFAAHLAGMTENVIITSSSFEGGSASGTINVSPTGRERFMLQCRSALSRLNSEASSTSTGIQIRYNQRYMPT